jgi:signal peptidase I
MRKVLLSILILLSWLSFIVAARNPSIAALSENISYVEMKSASMFPTLDSGDTLLADSNITISQIYTAPMNASAGSGDILLFNALGTSELIAHRAIGQTMINGQIYFITQGDNNLAPGPSSPTPATNVVGKIIAYQRTFNAGTWNNNTYDVTIETNSTFYRPLGVGSVQPPNYTGGNFAFDPISKTITFDVLGYISRANGGYCNVTIPTNLLTSSPPNSWKVQLNGTSTTYAATQNSTDTSIYFVYDQPTYTITITGTTTIPELPIPKLLLITALTATIITVAAAKLRKRSKNTLMHENPN